MKKLRFLSPIIFATHIFASDPILPVANQEQFNQYWKLVEESVGDKESFQEWIPAVEREEDWSKSFGLQRYQLDKEYDLEHFYNLFIETLSADFDNHEEVLHHEVLEQDDSHLMFCWWCDKSDYEVGREWVHLVKGGNNEILFLRFATKDKEVNPRDELWREALSLQK